MIDFRAGQPFVINDTFCDGRLGYCFGWIIAFVSNGNNLITQAERVQNFGGARARRTRRIILLPRE